MGSFVHSKNSVTINDEYRFSLDLFKKLEPNYSLPEGMILRKYIQGNVHYVTTGYMEIVQPLDWSDGDRYIDRLGELLYLEQHEKIKEEERKEHLNRVRLEEEKARNSVLEKKKQE